MVASRSSINEAYNTNFIKSITDTASQKIMLNHLDKYNETKDGKVIEDHYSLNEISPKLLQADTKINELIKTSEAAFENDINKIVGHSTIPLYRNFVIENTIDTFILDALKWKIKDLNRFMEQLY